MKIYLFIILSVLPLSSAFSKSDTINYNSIALLTGIISHYNLDNSLSPLIYKGVSIPIALSYHRIKKNNFQKINFIYDKAELTSSITNVDYSHKEYYESATLAILEYSFQKQLKPNKKGDIYLGLLWRNHVYYKNHYFNQKAGNWPAGDVFFDIGITVDYNYSFSEKLKLNFSSSYAIVSYVIGRIYSSNHSPESTMGENDINYSKVFLSGDFLTVDSFYDFNCSFNLSYKLNRSFSFNGIYDFNYYSFYKLQRVQSGKNIFLIGIAYEF